jgi:hypothetical protein
VECHISLKTILVVISSTLYSFNIINVSCRCTEMITIILEEGQKVSFVCLLIKQKIFLLLYTKFRIYRGFMYFINCRFARWLQSI